jgi:predicted DNA-binding antitoxin AbrB/MazE fold protein
MSQGAEAIYEHGVLRLLRPIYLPEQARVQVEVRSAEDSGAHLIHRIEEVLLALGLIKPLDKSTYLAGLSEQRLAEVAAVYGDGGPLSDLIIAERDGR